MSDQELAPAEQEKLNEFQIITNFHEDDYDKVVKLLKNNYWNLEVSLSKYFDGQLDQEAEREVEETSDSRNIQGASFNQGVPVPLDQVFTSNEFGNINDDPFALPNWQQLDQQPAASTSSSFFRQLPLVRPITGKWRSHPGLQAKPNQPQPHLSFFTSTFGSLTESPMLFLLLLIPRTFTFILTSITRLFQLIFPPSPDSLPDEPTLPTFSMAEYYKATTKDEFPLQFFEGEFNDAFNITKLENKYLLLILIGDNELSKNFIKNILNNPQVQEYLKTKENQISIYAGNVNEPQSYEIAKTLKLRSSFPSVLLIANVANGPSGISSMSILSKIPTRSANGFISKLTKTIEIFNPELLSKKFEQEELEFSRKIRELQDKAYEDSLNSDKQKEEARKLEKEIEEAKLKHEKFIKENKFKFYASLLKKFEEGQSESTEPKTRIRFKFPDGRQLVETFTKSSTIFDVYCFIDLKLHLGTLNEDEISELSSHTDFDIHNDYKHQFNFELISPFPRIAIDRNDVTKEIIEVKELWPNGNLLIEYDDSEADEDEDEDEE